MSTTRAGLADVVEYHHDRPPDEPEALDRYRGLRRALLGRGLVGAGAIGSGGLVAGLLGWLASPAAAASRQSGGGMDVQAAQTAASLENLAVAVYGTAAGLPFMKSIPDPAGSTVVAFVTMTVKQHTEHATAFNGAVAKLGGKQQTGVDQVVMDKVVTPALPTLRTPLDVVRFAAQLEAVAAATYSVETAAVDDPQLRKTFASIMGVENQHRAVLLAVGALLENDLADQIKLPPDLARLPAAAGNVGFPDAFLTTQGARPADEGAVK